MTFAVDLDIAASCIGGVGCILSALVAYKAYKTAPNQFSDTKTFLLIANIALTDCFHSFVWVLQLNLVNSSIVSGSSEYCWWSGVLLHEASVISILWHFLMNSYAIITIMSLTPRYNYNILTKLENIKFAICWGVLLVIVVIEIACLRASFGERCVYEKNEECHFEECWIKNKHFDWFWVIVGIITFLASFSLAIFLTKQIGCCAGCRCCHYGYNPIGQGDNDRTDNIKREKLALLLPWLITFTLFRGGNIIMRFISKYHDDVRHSPIWVTFVVIVVSLYGIGTCVAWFFTHTLTKRFNNTRSRQQHYSSDDSIAGTNNESIENSQSDAASVGNDSKHFQSFETAKS